MKTLFDSVVSDPGVLIYGIFNAIAYAVGGYFFYRVARAKRYPFETLFYIGVSGLLGAALGSRIGSVLFVYPDYYMANPLHVFLPQLGGKTLVGGLIGGYCGVVIAKKFLKVTRSTGDLFVPGLCLGIGIGRLGCFFNGCCHGAATSLPWAVRYEGVLRHPTQLYESLFCFFLFFVLWKYKPRLHREGDLFKLFLLFYAVFRFVVEFIRADRVGGFLGLSIAQGITACVAGALCIYFWRKAREAHRA